MTIMENAARSLNSTPGRIILNTAIYAVLLTAGCARVSSGQPALKDAYSKDFLIGVAVNQSQCAGQDKQGDSIIKANFDSITPENVLKWEFVHPKPETYSFAEADLYVKFGEENHMLIVGHTLVWHSQTPHWVFQDTNGQPLDREALLQRMHEHIQTVIGHYKGRIKVWDVVNEALNEDGTLRRSPWLKIIGEDYIAKAFQYAHEADPGAVLRYNDYGLELKAKRKGAIALIKKLRAQGVPVTAIGLQGHANLNWPTAEQEDTAITNLAELKLPLMVTEMDIDCSRGGQRTTSADVAANARLQAEGRLSTTGLSAALQQQLADRYSELFGVFIKHKDVVKLVTLWGVTDADSWRARGNPLLFDRNGRPKPAFDAVIKAAGR
ncbi:MAG: endo-1,4-beta-xylanase [Verrucomicrobiota bacterium]